ncbi:MAG: isoprenylcysteine carboxylmethyltransferase family protein [Proteobacteria bacterium]|nr:isoprenylcysteine carboxylmethyltransferase family protein [Pseudomonadota bacterium]
MFAVYKYLFPAMWSACALYWVVMARGNKANVRHESPGSRLLHFVPLALAVVLLWRPVPLPALLTARFLPRAAWVFWIGAVLALAGFLFAIWARAYIGRNWSAAVTVKAGHELVTTGPYAVVRHPIYAGLLLAFVGTALARSDLGGMVAVVLVWGAFRRKIRLEERWMREQFGAAYGDYARRVPALLPGT